MRTEADRVCRKAISYQSDTGIFRVLRGGSADNLGRRNAEFARSARRSWGHPDLKIAQRGMNRAGVGFRVVAEVADAGK